MPSASFHVWATARAAALDEIEAAHKSVGGRGPGRRYATRQINHAYAVFLSAEFQAFCRDLYDECVQAFVVAVSPADLQIAVRRALKLHSKLSHGNPNPGNIGADFNRLGLPFWDDAIAADARNAARRSLLEDLNRWRNAIAHHDFNAAVLGPGTLRLERVRAWRTSCNGLASSFDEVVRIYLARQTGVSPW